MPGGASPSFAFNYCGNPRGKGLSSEQILADFPDLEPEELQIAWGCFFGFKEANRG
jgi:hypothetical protein